VSERYIIIPNWDEFQHYKQTDRPAWIKLYTRLLAKDEYLGLTLAQRGVLHGLWMMYAASGTRPLSSAHSRHLLSTFKGDSRHFQEHLEALNNAGLIQFVSRPALEKVYTREEKNREEPSFVGVEQPQTAPAGRKEVIDVIVETDDDGQVIDLREILKEVG
jgi:hypothetical protein